MVYIVAAFEHASSTTITIMGVFATREAAIADMQQLLSDPDFEQCACVIEHVVRVS